LPVEPATLRSQHCQEELALSPDFAPENGTFGQTAEVLAVAVRQFCRYSVARDRTNRYSENTAQVTHSQKAKLK
jgi:hypothetical protein